MGIMIFYTRDYVPLQNDSELHNQKAREMFWILYGHVPNTVLEIDHAFDLINGKSDYNTVFKIKE
jgi:hypothetical protein